MEKVVKEVKTIVMAEACKKRTDKYLEKNSLPYISALQSIYNSYESKEKIIKLLENPIDIDFLPSCYYYLNFEFLMENLEISSAFSGIIKNFNENKSNTVEITNLVKKCLIRMKFIIDNCSFNYKNKEKIIQEIKDLEKFFDDVSFMAGSGIPKYFEEISKRLYSKSAEEVMKKYNKDNLGEDIEEINEKIGEHELREELAGQLKKIREEEPETENDYASCIGDLRSFLQHMIVDIAEKIADENEEKIEKKECNNSKYQNCLTYLKKKNITNGAENRFIKKLYHVLSGEGSHEISAPSEKYRLWKNITIELILMLLKYSDKTLKENKSIRKGYGAEI